MSTLLVLLVQLLAAGSGLLLGSGAQRLAALALLVLVLTRLVLLHARLVLLLARGTARQLRPIGRPGGVGDATAAGRVAAGKGA